MSKIAKFLRLELISALAIPLFLIILYIIFLVTLKRSLPSSDELIGHLTALYERYGYEVIFFGAFFEALVIINIFIPGSVAVGLGAVFARTGEVDLTAAVILASAGAVLGYSINFLLGFLGFGQIIKKLGYGGALAQAKSQIESNIIKSFSLGYIHPNLGSLLSLAAGTSKISLKTFFFLTIVSTLAWVSFWGILIFTFGEVFLTLISKYMFVLVLLVLSTWILAILYERLNKTKKQP